MQTSHTQRYHSWIATAYKKTIIYIIRVSLVPHEKNNTVNFINNFKVRNLSCYLIILLRPVVGFIKQDLQRRVRKRSVDKWRSFLGNKSINRSSQYHDNVTQRIIRLNCSKTESDPLYVRDGQALWRRGMSFVPAWWVAIHFNDKYTAETIAMLLFI